MFTREEQIEHEKAWKLNDERNKRLAEQAEKERKQKALEWLEAIR